MSGVTRTVVPSGRSTGSNNSILPSRTTARTVLSMAHASSSGDGGFLSTLLCQKVRRSAAPCLAPVYVVLAWGLLYDKDLCIFFRPLGADTAVQRRGSERKRGPRPSATAGWAALPEGGAPLVGPPW